MLHNAKPIGFAFFYAQFLDRSNERHPMNTSHYAMAFAGTAIALLLLDITWIVLVMQPLFRGALGALMRAEIAFIPGALFYLLYLIGVVFFAVIPSALSGDVWGAALRGALLGLVAYGTYELTNYSTLKDWPIKIVLIDMAWGVCMTAASAAMGVAAVRIFAR